MRCLLPKTWLRLPERDDSREEPPTPPPGREIVVGTLSMSTGTHLFLSLLLTGPLDMTWLCDVAPSTQFVPQLSGE